jgi:hypothetical protein
MAMNSTTTSTARPIPIHLSALFIQISSKDSFSKLRSWGIGKSPDFTDLHLSPARATLIYEFFI